MVLADIEAELDEYCDYDIVGSAERCGLYIVAARKWLRMVAESASNQGSSMSIGKSHVENMLQRAESYLSANKQLSSGASPRVRFLSAEGYR